jgi:V-type H+-transporting ATPase subunit a
MSRIEVEEQRAIREGIAGDLFRSQPMKFVRITISTDPNAARDAVERLVETDSVMFLDDMAVATDQGRRFRRDVFQCSECERVLRYLTGEINKYVDEDPDGSRARAVFAGNAGGNIGMSSNTPSTIEQLLDQLIEFEQNVVQNTHVILQAHKKIAKKKEHQYVIELASKVLVSVSASNFDRSSPNASGIQMTDFNSTDEQLPEDESAALLESGLFSSNLVMHVTGVINVERAEKFKQVLFRSCRSNVVTKCLPINEKLMDHNTGELVQKCVFIVFVTAEPMLKKVTNICQAFNCSVYECPRMTAEERIDLINRKSLTEADLDKDREVVRMTEHNNEEDFWKVAHSIELWKDFIHRNSVIFHHLNKFRVVGADATATAGQYMAVHAWIPAAREYEIGAAFGMGREGKHMMEEKVSAGSTVPTFFPTDKVTGAFQGIVNAYGVARYQEINPGLFAIIFFPFLFGVMFGDILHGSFLLIFSLFCIYKEDELKTIDNELFKMPFQGRYLLLLMSIMSIYMGFIYNEFASVPFNIWGSAWPEFSGEEQPRTDIYTLINHEGKPYPFGLDPAWRWSGQNIQFTNSLKMKMSIILGVSQMTLGVILKAVNQLYFKNPYNEKDATKRRLAEITIVHESIPELTLFMSTFGYLVILIFSKWSTNWNGQGEDRILAPRGPPQIINTLIDFAMMKPVETQNVLLWADTCDLTSATGVCSGQTYLQRLLLLLAVVCVPWLLLGKVIMIGKMNDERKGAHGESYQRLAVDEEDEEEASPVQHDMSEIFIHQTIHTIEYVLGCISNTASYLRLWALSLAHSQLSEVFWNYILNGQKFGVGMNSSTSMLVACFFVWFAATMGVLMVMETLSAFLHALRLQWVEFQGKFYAADGILFAPASMRKEDE